MKCLHYVQYFLEEFFYLNFLILFIIDKAVRGGEMEVIDTLLELCADMGTLKYSDDYKAKMRDSDEMLSRTEVDALQVVVVILSSANTQKH